MTKDIYIDHKPLRYTSFEARLFLRIGHHVESRDSMAFAAAMRDGYGMVKGHAVSVGDPETGLRDVVVGERLSKVDLALEALDDPRVRVSKAGALLPAVAFMRIGRAM